MKPILQMVAEWMSVLRDAGYSPDTGLVRACVKKQLIDSGQDDRLFELDLKYPSEQSKKRKVYNFMSERGLINKLRSEES
jgi:hypothetical protein